MKNSWTQTFRRLAAGCAVAGATAFSSAMCYAISASDSASDPVYAPAWDGITNSDASPYAQLTTGDNGGFGFNAWNFNSSYYWDFAHGGPGAWYNYNQNIHGIDASSNTQNNIGTAWDLGVVEYQTNPSKLSLPRGGRGFKSLIPGQTFSTTIDNPNSGGDNFKGYSFALLSAPAADSNGMGLDGNTCYHSSNCTPGILPVAKGKLSLYAVNTGANTEWRLSDSGATDTLTGLLTSATAAGGVRIDVTLTGPDAYSLTMTPLAGGSAYVHSGTLANAGLPTNYAFYQNYNGVAGGVNTATSLYISEMSVVPEPATFGLLVLAAGTLLSFGTARRRKEA